MGLIPKSKLGQIGFYEAHISPFTTNQAAIGILTTDVTDITTKTTNARAAYDVHVAAQQAAKTATESFYNSVAAMSTFGATLIAKIRAKAEATGNPNVYTLAEIPAPATPTPVGAPGKPFDFGVVLNEDGSLQINWKCNNPSGAGGTMYQVFRRDGDEGEFNYLGGTGKKLFLDETIPAGTANVVYKIQAVRSTKAGLWGQFLVNFGVSGATVTVQSVSKKAA